MLCEYCGQNEGVTNSHYRCTTDHDKGDWVCFECEQELQEDHESFIQDMSSTYIINEIKLVEKQLDALYESGQPEFGYEDRLIDRIGYLKGLLRGGFSKR